MKYQLSFKNQNGDIFDLTSMEDYVPSNSDIDAFTKVLSDPSVRQYITDEAVKKYDHPNIESLTKDILRHSALRWYENKEKRFLVRDVKNNPVGMIGVTLNDPYSGELWYYKTSSVGPFMKDALAIILRFLKQEQITGLTACIEPDNTRSSQILSVCGFCIEKIDGLVMWHKKI